MRKFVLIIVTLLLGIGSAWAQGLSIEGKVSEKSTGEPVEFATVLIEETGQWAVTDAKGLFSIKNLTSGKITVVVSSLGYVEDRREVSLSKSTTYNISLREDNLALDGAVVTAQEENGATTGRTISKTALDHVQVMNVSDITSLLPGGVTSNPSLTGEKNFVIRSGSSSEDGNASFGTAVEVDGVRLSNNASMGISLSKTSQEIKGVATNNIASSNIESVEVITGVPSVEYGDMTSGVVKINTKKGKTPLTVTMSTSPKMKQVSASKGFGLGTSSSGASNGVINASLEYTNSFSQKMSPYTSYDRKQLSLTYSNMFSRGIFTDTPLRFSASVTGNLGGLNDQADPDKHVTSFTIERDNTLRGNITASWLLNKSWITNLELNASASYSDKLERVNKPYSNASSSEALHGKEEGYLIATPYIEGGNNAVVQIAPGYWTNVMALGDKPFTTKVTLKATWHRNFGKVNNLLKIGGDWSADKNFGFGRYSENEATAPTYRTYRYDELPLMSNIAAYIEDNVMIPVGDEGRINLIAGLRNDNTIIPGSAYGTTSSLSPRFNGKYTIRSEKNHRKDFLRELSLRASWGIAVKMPSYAVLYPEPSYQDINVFSSTVSSTNQMFRAYYTIPRTIEYNSALRWQRNHQTEIGVETNLGGARISLAGFYNKTLDSYRLSGGYDRFTYNYTNPSAVQGLAIPADNRVYSIDGKTGTVTVSDKTGTLPSQTVTGTSRKQFLTNYTEENCENPITRTGLEWVIDFPRINPINTTIRLDGTFYQYESVFTNMEASGPVYTSGYDGTPYKYIGYYYGGDNLSNGTRSRNLNTNITLTTNIPKVRMIISMKVETSLVKYTQFLSERTDGKERSFSISDPTDPFSKNGVSFYDNDVYAVTYPDFYETYDNPGVRRPFQEDILDAKAKSAAEIASGTTGGPYTQLYNDLSKLIQKSSYLYYYRPNSISPYFCVNFSVTKEIGDLASVSFYANNFFNSQAQVFSSRTRNYASVGSYIPNFYYGLTVRFKF